MSEKLTSTVGETGWCGPTAFAAVTGIPVPVIEQEILSYRRATEAKPRKRGGHNKVVGVWADEVEPVLDRLGFKARLTQEYRSETPYDSNSGTVDERYCPPISEIAPELPDDELIIVGVSKHFMAMHNGYITDTQYRKPIHFGFYKRGKRRVTHIWYVSKK